MPSNTLSGINRLFLFFLLLAPGFFSGCDTKKGHVAQPATKGNILFTCDDWDVDNWYSYRDSFLKYDVKVTFYVSHYHEMTPAKIGKLHTLQNDGHEIAYHTLNHPFIDPSYTPEQIRRYVEVELDSGMDLMRADGFNVRTFAFPGGFSIPALVDSVKTRFERIRTNNFGFYEYWDRRQSYQLKVDDPSRIFVPYGIDNASGFFDRPQWNMVLSDVKSGRSVSLLFHYIQTQGDYSTNPEDFMQIIREIHAEGIKCITVGEFFGYQ